MKIPERSLMEKLTLRKLSRKSFGNWLQRSHEVLNLNEWQNLLLVTAESSTLRHSWHPFDGAIFKFAIQQVVGIGQIPASHRDAEWKYFCHITGIEVDKLICVNIAGQLGCRMASIFSTFYALGF